MSMSKNANTTIQQRLFTFNLGYAYTQAKAHCFPRVLPSLHKACTCRFHGQQKRHLTIWTTAVRKSAELNAYMNGFNPELMYASQNMAVYRSAEINSGLARLTSKTNWNGNQHTT